MSRWAPILTVLRCLMTYDVSGLPRLISALRDSGYDQFVLNKLLWGNWQKVLQNVWQQ